VLLTTDLRAKVGDFGTAKLVQQRAQASSGYRRLAVSAKPEATVGPVGTPLYMPPEVLCNRPFTPEGDVFSFGQLLWEVAMERVPDPSVDNPDWFKHGPYLTQLSQFWESGQRLHLQDEGQLVNIREYCRLYKQCVSGVPKDRPSFGTIVEILEHWQAESPL
jgi:serine/threonine protein kinase